MEKAGLLNLLWASHFHRAPITIFVIRQLHFLVHGGYIWLEESIPIMSNLIHHISRLPCKRKEPAIIARKGSDLGLAEAMKEKYKLEKKKRGYSISGIKDKGVCLATQLLAGKLMRKCHADKVPESVITLAEQCVEGVQLNWA